MDYISLYKFMFARLQMQLVIPPFVHSFPEANDEQSCEPGARGVLRMMKVDKGAAHTLKQLQVAPASSSYNLHLFNLPTSAGPDERVSPRFYLL